ncbi:MAG TPA: hypothetical protein VGC42_05010 [Kofleriaceae bacterium]
MRSNRRAVIAAGLALAVVAIYAFHRAPMDVDTHVHLALLDTHFVSPFELNRWGGPDGETRRWIAAGLYPWYKHPDSYLVEVRPLWSGVVTLAYAMFGRAPLPYYLTSLAVFLGFLGAVWAWLRRQLPGELPGLAICIFALDGLHAESAVWFANLHSVVGGALAMLAVVMHVRWREGWTPGRWLALGLAALALAFSETCLGAFGFVVAYELLCATGSPAQRLRALLPLAAICVAFLALLKLGGVGAKLNPLYADPFSEPGRFLSIAVHNLRWYFEASFGGLGLGWAALLCAITAPWFLAGMRARPAPQRRIIWAMLLGGVLSLIPVLGVIQAPIDPGMLIAVRCLLYFTIGLAVCWAVALWHAASVAARAGRAAWLRIAAAVATLVMIGSLFVWSPVRFVQLVRYWFVEDDDAVTIDAIQRVPLTCRDTQRVVWLRGPRSIMAFREYYLLAARLGWPASEVGRQVTVAPPGKHPLRLARTGDRTIELRSDRGPVNAGDARLNSPRPLPPGPIPVPGGEVRVLELAETQPSRIELRFTEDPAASCFVVQAPDGGVTRISLPAPGTEAQL